MLSRRRALTTGGAALAAGLTTSFAHGQDSPFSLEELALRANLFVRVGAAIWLNGRGPFMFVIDTGAGRTALSDTLAEQLQIPPAGAPLLVHSITGSEITRSARIARLALGGQRFSNLVVPVLPKVELAADGLLGLDVLSRFDVSFDLDRQVASLRPPGMRVSQNDTEVTGTTIGRRWIRSARGRFGQLLMRDIRVDGASCAAFVDSGAQHSVGNAALAVAISERRPRILADRRPVSIFGVTGRSISAEAAVVENLVIGGSRMGRAPLLFADLHVFDVLGLKDRPTLLIGADLISQFRRVTLEFQRNRVAFEGLYRNSRRNSATVS